MNSLSTYAKLNGGTFTGIRPPDTVVGTDLIATNPSVVYYNGKHYINQRVIDYTKIYSSEAFSLCTNDVNQIIYQGLHDRGYTSVNVVTDASDGRQWTVRLPAHPRAAYNGLEDARFVVWDGMLYMYGTRMDVCPGQGNICIYLMDTDSFTAEREWVVKNGTPGMVEKNWMAVPDMPFTFIYKPSPTTVARVNPDTCTYSLETVPGPNALAENVRGSTPLFRLDKDTYGALVHSSDGWFDTNGRYHLEYRSRAVLYDNRLNVEKASDWFVFMNGLTEFCCGACVNGEKVAFTHSLFDGSSFLTELEIGKFTEFIGTSGQDRNLFTEKYLYSEAVSMEKRGLNAIPWFNALACSARQTDSVHYESAVRVLAFWARNPGFVRDNLDNLIFLAYKCTKLFPDRCEAFYLLSMFEGMKGGAGHSTELKSRADKLRNGRRSVIDRYIPLHYL